MQKYLPILEYYFWSSVYRLLFKNECLLRQFCYFSKGKWFTATTYFKKHKISKGETVTQPLKERFDYEQNPDKAQDGELIFSYECDYMTANAEFLLSKPKYKATTGREQRRDSNVLCYQIRQSFRLGEIPPGGGKPGGF